MLRCCYVTGHGWGGGILTFTYLAYTHKCYAAATSLGMGGAGGGIINVHVPCVHTWMLRCCYVTGHGWGGGEINVHVPCVHTWMLRCCYVTGHGWGEGILTFMHLAYIVDATLLLRHWAWVGWGGILAFTYLAYTRGCYAAATSLGMGGVGGDN